MKKVLIIIAALFMMAVQTQAQTKIGNGINQTLYTTYDEAGVVLSCSSQDISYDWHSVIAITTEDYPSFEQFIRNSVEKYMKWKSIADSTITGTSGNFTKEISSIKLDKSRMIVIYTRETIPSPVTVSATFKFTYNPFKGFKNYTGNVSELILTFSHENDIYNVYVPVTFKITSGTYTKSVDIDKMTYDFIKALSLDNIMEEHKKEQDRLSAFE